MIKEVINQLIRLINREPKTADQNPATSNPEITPEAIMSNIALITKVKKPSVNMLIGRVMINKKARTNLTLDYGVGKNGAGALYLNLNEYF